MDVDDTTTLKHSKLGAKAGDNTNQSICKVHNHKVNLLKSWKRARDYGGDEVIRLSANQILYSSV